MSITEKAVAQLRGYARYLDENAENIIGNIDAPTWMTEGGITISFTLGERDRVPTLEVDKEYIVLDAMGGEGE